MLLFSVSTPVFTQWFNVSGSNIISLILELVLSDQILFNGFSLQPSCASVFLFCFFSSVSHCHVGKMTQVDEGCQQLGGPLTSDSERNAGIRTSQL